MASRYRPRKEYKFWLFHDLPEHKRLMEFIQYCKSTRQFARVVRDGIRLIWSLREGNMAILFELFPHLERQFNPDATDLLEEFRTMMLHSRVVDAPPAKQVTEDSGASNKLASKQIDLPVFEDEDDGDTIVLGKRASSMNGANLMSSVLELGD